MNYPKQQTLFQEDLDSFSKLYNEAMDEIEHESESFWSSLNKQEQLQVFCAVVRRIYKAELQDCGSYRHALYTVFGFGPESYAVAQMSGYLTLHNQIHSLDHDSKLLTQFCKKYCLDVKLVEDFLL